MQYITAKEAAQRWGVSLRQVQRLLAGNRIPYAKKYGHSWMIPADAQKPVDPRSEKKSPEKSLSSDLAYVIKAAYVSVPRNNPDSIPYAVGEERLRQLHEGGLAYLRGDFERTIRCFHKHDGDDAAKLCACSVAIVAAMSTGDYPLFTEIEDYLKGFVQANISGVTAYAEFLLASGYLGAMAPNMVPDWLKEGDFSALPTEVKPDALYMRAKYFQCVGKYEAMLAVAETALSVYALEQKISYPDTYLRLMCAIALYSLERPDEARRYLLSAMRINLPHGFITPFAELMPILGGMVEQCLEREFPGYYDAVITLWKRIFTNWIVFHNRFTKTNITLILTLREYEMALLISQGVPRAKIAERFFISTGRLNNIMKEIYGKLFVSNRQELSKFII